MSPPIPYINDPPPLVSPVYICTVHLFNGLILHKSNQFNFNTFSSLRLFLFHYFPPYFLIRYFCFLSLFSFKPNKDFFIIYT